MLLWSGLISVRRRIWSGESGMLALFFLYFSLSSRNSTIREPIRVFYPSFHRSLCICANQISVV